MIFSKVIHFLLYMDFFLGFKYLCEEINVLSQCDSEYVTKYYGSFLKKTKLWISKAISFFLSSSVC